MMIKEKKNCFCFTLVVQMFVSFDKWYSLSLESTSVLPFLGCEPEEGESSFDAFALYSKKKFVT